MKPNPEQDADRAAFEKWCLEIRADINLLDAYNSTARQAYEAGYQAAKADSRAMQNAFEQVCKALHELAMLDDEAQTEAYRNAYFNAHKALSLAAPFRKTGV